MAAPAHQTAQMQAPDLDAAARRAARRVLLTEARALAHLARAVPPDFAAVVDRIAALPGRVIVTGIGKSGHIARKIAATLASTGTPASFVHPSEASHGDLGMIGPGDLCLALSNSGETAELGDILAYSRRFAVPLVALTGRADSTLGRAADLVLAMPAAPEACPMGLAPTTSTTLALAMGDALAVALMERRGFAADRFRDLHPGGRLGARLLAVAALMHGDDALPRVRADAPMGETLLEMTSKGFGIAAVVDAAGRLTGIVTDGDLRRNMAGLMDRRAGQIATPDPVTVAPDCLAARALAILTEAKISALLVVEDGRPVGVVHVHDLLRAGVA